MKLKTIKGPVAPCGTIEAIEHDAMAAHALMQAMDEFKAVTGQIDDGESIEIRAGMILREWGFDSGEVE